MDQYLNPTTQQVMAVSDKYISRLQEHPEEWRDMVEKLIQKISGGQIRAFQTFFESPEEAYSGSCCFQALAESDLRAMYPRLLDLALSIKDKNTYLYIFTCNNALPSSTSLIAHTILSFPK